MAFVIAAANKFGWWCGAVEISAAAKPLCFPDKIVGEHPCF